MYVEAKFLISKYGQDVCITSSHLSAPIYSKAFVQPLRCDRQSELYGDYSPEPTTEQFLYIGMPDVQVNAMPEDAIITAKNQNYIVKKAENVYLSGRVIYERAVLEKS